MLLLTASPLHFSSASSSSSFFNFLPTVSVAFFSSFFQKKNFSSNPKLQLTQLFLFRRICVPNYITTTTRRKETTRRFDHVVRLLCRLISFIQASSLSSVFVI